MKCPTCQSEDRRSFVRVGWRRGDAQYTRPHYEDGVLHLHDTSTAVMPCRCSRGHTWEEPLREACPAVGCGWEAGEEGLG